MEALLGLKRVPECSAAKIVCVLSAILAGAQKPVEALGLSDHGLATL
jgi:hypothetical protein